MGVGCSLNAPAHTEAPPPTMLPAFVYPAEPPIVTLDALQRLMVRLDADQTLLWVFDGTTAFADTARQLAEKRDALRWRQVAVIGLYTGPADDWEASVVPLLRGADANFPCAVMDPSETAALGTWLIRQSGTPASGLYLLAQSRGSVRVLDSEGRGLGAVLEELTRDGPASTQPSDKPPGWQARVRLIELASGRVLGRAEAQADEPAQLARLLGEQLRSALSAPPSVAVIPLRRAGREAPDAPDQGLLLADHLGRYLEAVGWQHIVPAHQAEAVLAGLDRSRVSAEFAPEGLAGQTNWQIILVGVVRGPSEHP